MKTHIQCGNGLGAHRGADRNIGGFVPLQFVGALVAGCLALSAVAPIRAAVIPVQNYSFEDPDLGHNTFGTERFSTTAPPAWLGVGSSGSGTSVGVFDPSSNEYTGADGPVLTGTADGAQCGYLNLPAGFSNDFTYNGTSLGVFAIGQMYTLRVAVGGRRDAGLPPNLYSITLLSGGTPVGVPATGAGTADTFYDLVYTFTATAGQAGQPIGIRLSASNTSASFEQANFDNVRLVVPEPASLGLLSFAAIGMMRRRRIA